MCGDGSDRHSDRARRMLGVEGAGVFYAELGGDVVDCNLAFARMAGRDSPEEVVGRPTAEYVPVPGAPREVVERMRTEGELEGVEVPAAGADGSGWWALVHARVTADPDLDGRAVVGSAVDVTERVRLREQLRAKARRDPLTGLADRRLLEEKARELLALADRRGRHVGLAYLDIDEFRRVNSRWGHPSGDRVLEEVGRRLEGTVRESDVVARIGGDEFVVLLADMDDADGSRPAVGRLEEAFREPFRETPRPVSLDPTVGVATYPDDADEFEGLLQAADAAMYRTKAREEERGGESGEG